MKSRHFLVVTILAAVFAAVPPIARAASDEKFAAKAAETVWGIDLPEFDPRADLSDSIFSGCSAVRIAYMRNLVAGHESVSSLRKYMSTGRVSTNATMAIDITRVMMKLNDAAAVEEYSDFDIRAKSDAAIAGYKVASTNTAFGARVHKPDGSVVTVDTGDAYTLTAGKKERDVSHRIAIPGLEPGDVIEYFYYDEVYLDEVSLPAITIRFAGRYPTRSYILDCSVAEELTLEYMPLNGAPVLSRVPGTGKGQPHVGFKLENLPAADLDIPFISAARQLPYMRLYIMNNNSRLVYHPGSARIGGIRIPTREMVTADIAYSINDITLPAQPVGKAASILKKWCKANPDATVRQIADAAWLATLYVAECDDRSYPMNVMPVFFSDVLKKAGVGPEAHIGVTGSRLDMPVTSIIHYNDPDYFARVGDDSYLPTSHRVFAPGEIPGYFAGEDAIVYATHRGHKFYNKSCKDVKLPVGKASANNAHVKIGVSVPDMEDDRLEVTLDATFTGTYKQSFSSLVDGHDMLDAIESYLALDEKTRGSRERPDSVRRASGKKEIMASVSEILLGSTVRDMRSWALNSRGCTPAEPRLSFSVEGGLEGLVTRAGKNLVVKIGSLTGKQMTVEGSRRKREVDILRRSPDNTRIDITLDLPEGYDADDASLDALARNVSTSAGTFFTKATRSGENPSQVTLSVNVRNPKIHYPLSAWDDMLALIDAQAAFTGATLTLVPRQ